MSGNSELASKCRGLKALLARGGRMAGLDGVQRGTPPCGAADLTYWTDPTHA